MMRRVFVHGISAVLSVSLSLFAFTQEPENKLPPQPTFEQLLQKMTGEAPESCGDPGGFQPDQPGLEEAAFRGAAERLTAALSAAEGNKNGAKTRADAALKEMERLSAEVDAAWPAEKRFHGEVFDFDPALVVKMTIRSQANYFAFAVPKTDESGKPNNGWRQIGAGEPNEPNEVPYTSVELYPLHRGPSGGVRFLASFVRSGCAGSWGVLYDVEDWRLEGSSFLQVLKQEGAIGMGDSSESPGLSGKHPFAQIGTLQTKGTKLTLPYCWFSAIDTWDNPNMCAAATWDLSGDSILFLSERYNRPDLLPVARVIEYAGKHDYPAVRAYCASDAVARTIVRVLPNGYGFEAELEVKKLGAGRERVRAAFSTSDQGFLVEKHGDRWLVVSFDPN